MFKRAHIAGFAAVLGLSVGMAVTPVAQATPVGQGSHSQVFTSPGTGAIPSPRLAAEAAAACTGTTRFSACTSGGGHFEIRDQSGTLQGSFDYTVVATTQTHASTNVITQSATYTVSNATGAQLTDTFTPTGCEGPCRPISTAPQVVTFTNGTHTGSATFAADQLAIGQVATVNPVWHVVVASPYGSNTLDGPIAGMPAQRCDRKLPGKNNTVGCVFSTVVPTWHPGAQTGNSYPAYDAHLQQAIAHGLPQTLTRADATTVALNANKACRQASTKPAPIIDGAPAQCDEYPMKSTNQGAASGGTVRSFTGCHMPSLPQNVQGSTGWSQCYISAAQNEGAGSDLLAFYNANRVLPGPDPSVEGDAFLVSP